MTAENELSPTMKIFAWRGPSRSDETSIEPEATTLSPVGAVPMISDNVTAEMPLTPHVEISLAGAVLRVTPNINQAQLIEVLCAIRSSASTTTQPKRAPEDGTPE
jgi:hypothetical protein